MLRGHCDEPRSLPYYGLSTSAIDHNGDLLVFDVIYSSPVAMPGQPPNLRTSTSAKTRVTVITGDGKKMNPVEYDGGCELLLFSVSRFKLMSLDNSGTSN